MANPEVRLGIRITGADRAADDLETLSDALSETSSSGGDAGESLSDLNDEQGKTTTLSGQMSGAIQNAAFQFADMAVQAESGTSWIRILSQQIPQLLGGFGAVGAVAGAGFGIALPILAAVFRGTKDVEEATRDLLDVYKELREAYADINGQQVQDQRDLMKGEDEILKGRLRNADREAAIRNGNDGLLLARTRAELELGLANDRIRLSVVERGIVTATGNDALRLAKERMAVVERIRLAEEGITENVRAQQLLAAENNLATAEKKFQATKESDGGTVKEAARLRSEIADLQAESEEVTRRRLIGVELLTDRLSELEKETKAAEERAFERFGLGDYAEALKEIAKAQLLKGAQANIKDDIRKENQVTNVEADLTAQQDELQSQLDVLDASLTQSAQAQKEAAQAFGDAMSGLRFLKQNQGIERTSEKQIDAVEEGGKLGSEINTAVDTAIQQIQANAQAQGRGVNPVEEETIGRLEKLVNDSIPDGEQGEMIASILQNLANSMNAKDAMLYDGITELINVINLTSQRYSVISAQIQIASVTAKQAAAAAATTTGKLQKTQQDVKDLTERVNQLSRKP